MATLSAARPTCCCRSGPPPGRTCWSGRCSPSNCSGRLRALRTTPIIAKGKRMRRFAPLLVAIPLLLAASAPVQPVSETVDEALKRARAEARAADAQVRKLERAAEEARGEAARLHAQQAAAAEAIAAAEARISAADAERRIIAARIASRRQR